MVLISNNDNLQPSGPCSHGTETITERCFSCQNKSVCQKLARSCKTWKSAKIRYTPFVHEGLHLDSFWNRGTRELRNGLLQGMRDRSMRSGTELVRKIKLTDWSMAGNLSNRSSGVQIPCDICTRLKRYLYSAKCSWIIKHDIPWVTFILLVLYTQAYWQVGNITKEIQVTSGIFRFK